MSRADRKDPEKGADFSTSVSYIIVPTNLTEHAADGHRYRPYAAEIHTSQEEPKFMDSSGPVFRMYLKKAEDEDNNITGSLQRDAEGIRLFVRPCVIFCVVSHVNLVNI